MENDPNKGYILIDAPVGPFHPSGDIKAWIKELEAMPDKPEVKSALNDANRWLKDALIIENSK